MTFRDKTSPLSDSIFGRVSMGYTVIESMHLKKWETLLHDGIGLHLDPESDALRCRLDDHQCRMLVKKGVAENLVALGLELADEAALKVVLNRVRSAGMAIAEHTGPEAKLRGVERFWAFKGPKNLTIECHTNPTKSHRPPQMLCQGFVTGEQGFGHIAMVTKRQADVFAFWQRLFDIRHTDDVQEYRSGARLHFQFLRFNKRHHSIALASTPKLPLDPIRTTVQHVQMQMLDLNDVTMAYERCKSLGFQISMGIGQHANDRAVSFYVRTPSGFDLECGWNPRTVMEETWKGQIWDTSSIWGHSPEGHSVADFLKRLAQALSTAGHREELPQLSSAPLSQSAAGASPIDAKGI